MLGAFFKPVSGQNNSNVLLESFSTAFLEFQFLTQTEHFPKAPAHALWPILVIFQNMSFFKY